MPSPSRILLLYAALAVAALAVYAPALGGDWLWDDTDWIRDNEQLRSWGGLWRIWFEPGAVIQYYPLTYTTWWLDHHVWGLSTVALHVENVLLHAGNALLFGLLLRRLALPGAVLAALVFLVHPVHAESVAWMVERKNVLSGAFYLGTCHLWCAHLQRPSPASLTAALGCFLLALLAKTATLMLPVTLFAIAWWQRRSLAAATRRLLPFVALTLVFAVVTIVRERGEGAVGHDWDLSLPARVALLGQVVAVYAGKLLAPFDLSFSYAKWPIAAGTVSGWLPTVALMLACAASLRARRPWALAAACALWIYVANLLPVSGLVDYYYLRYAFTADHFQYLPSLGPIALLCCGGAALLRGARAGVVVAAAIVVGLAVMTWQRAAIYQDVETLWRATIASEPDAWLAHANLGNLLDERDGPGAGLAHHRRAVEIYPDAFESNNALGNHAARAGRFDEAQRHFDRALVARPDDPLTYNNLGAMCGMRGDYAAARAWFEQGRDRAPRNRDLLRNLVVVLSQVPDAEVRDPRRALRLARELVAVPEPSLVDEHALFRAML
ncbi:MAG: tetratricopeptide repeat protein, partial [Planctomycetes bacterium]|nr:tetratricopeptide repeat protein [Planctomycetota bacterium]